LISDNWAAAAMPADHKTGEPKKQQFPLAIPAVPSVPTLEVMASGPAFPKIGASELNESMLVPLVNQFGLMQQQMFDQFQQAMAMMVQMFGTMHRDQMEVIRAELDRLHDLTAEFHALKSELAQMTQAQPGEKAPIGRAELAQAAAADPDVSSPAPAFERSVAKETSAARALSGIQPQSPTSQVPPKQSSSGSPLSSVPPLPKPVVLEPRPTEQIHATDNLSRVKTDNASPAPDSERDSVAWLHQRIMTLQQERETRWQKILKLLPGVS
jgi:hypothetical protein